MPCALVAGFWLGAVSASAQNAAFQDFFFQACVNPTGALAARCDETPGDLGDLSGDSEDSLNPSQALAVHESSLGRARVVSRQVQERLEQRRAQAPVPDPDADEFGQWSLLLNGRWEDVDRERTSRERGWNGDIWTGQLGTDVRLGEASFLGVLASYERTDSEFDRDKPGVNFTPPGNDGDTDVDGLGLTLYGSHNFTESLYLDGAIGWGWSDQDLGRNAVFQDTTRTIPQTNLRGEGKTNGQELLATLGMGYDFALGAFGLGPYVRVNYLRSKVDGYREANSASGLQMRFEGTTQTSLAYVAGLRGGWALSTSLGVVVPQARVEYEYESRMDAVTTHARYVLDADKTKYRLVGDGPDRNHWNAAAGLLLVLPNGWIPFVEYEQLFGFEWLEVKRVTVGLRKEF